LTISDNGCGIPDEDKPRLFEPYFSTKKSGTGLGLAIVSTIISDHNGYIRVRDNEPRGTRFHRRTPGHWRNQERVISQRLARGSMHSILIIDDEQSIRDSLTGILQDEGFNPMTAANGEEALGRMRDERPDLILLDIWMPGMDGLETLTRIRDFYPEQLVIMMSGHGTIETAVRATKLGAHDFIEKPLSLEKLLLSIQNALKLNRLVEEKPRTEGPDCQRV